MQKLKDLDIVYVVKDSAYNAELRYSLRSVDKNFPHHRLWFYGGKPVGLHPDKQVVVKQEGDRKYDRVRNMLKMIAENDEITEDFVLFNDDFFVMDNVEDLPYYAWGSLTDLCVMIECKNNYRPTPYTTELKKTVAALASKYSHENFELHVPIIFNRRLLREVLEEFPDNKGTRSLYANKLLCSGKTDGSWFFPTKDVKIWEQDKIPKVSARCPYLSTSDESFTNGLVGDFIRRQFPDKSRWER